MVTLDQFHMQHSKTIQAWLSVEIEFQFLYAVIMDGANSHTVSATFNHIESFDSKLKLVNSCLALVISKDSALWKKWRNLMNQAIKLNAKRNNIVHEPISTLHEGGKVTISISPSNFDALAIAKGETSHNGPTINKEYTPASAKIREEHTINNLQLANIEREFKNFGLEMRLFRDQVKPDVIAAHKSLKG